MVIATRIEGPPLIEFRKLGPPESPWLLPL